MPWLQQTEHSPVITARQWGQWSYDKVQYGSNDNLGSSACICFLDKYLVTLTQFRTSVVNWHWTVRSQNACACHVTQAMMMMTMIMIMMMVVVLVVVMMMMTTTTMMMIIIIMLPCSCRDVDNAKGLLHN
jgi:hypothetical protein